MKQAQTNESPLIKVKVNSTEAEQQNREILRQHLVNSPISTAETLQNLGLFMTRQNLSQILFVDELYRKQLNVHGVIMEFGVRWGRNLALYEALRGIYEPFNHNRKIIGFDTFTGFPSVDSKDGTADIITEGAYGVSTNYEEYLSAVLDCHQRESPISHIKKYELVKGDAVESIKKYLDRHPETIISFAYFDFDIYKPTKACLEAIKGHLTKGSILGFDELNASDYPGETLALKEVFGLANFRIQHSPFSPTQSYFVYE